MDKNRRRLRSIRGSKGEDPKHVPTEIPNNLISKSYVRIIDLLGEGEIEGLIDGAKSIYINETPLENPNGTRNFNGVAIDTRPGSQDQSYMSGFSAVENEVLVQTEIRSDTPVGRQIANPNTDAVRVKIRLPSLTYTSPDTGDTTGTSVQLTIAVKDGNDSTIYSQASVKTGKTSSSYEYEIYVKLSGPAPWLLTVSRQTAESTSQFLQNKTYFESYTEVIESKLRYPNSAIVGIRLDSEQFSSPPTRFYEIRGLKIKVPTNYNPETREYTGVWDGTFKIAWSDNPAWVFYDLTTNARYGLGAYLSEDQIDKWGLYEIAQYCDELVSDGLGELEPRFTCNLLLPDRAEAYTVLQNLASVFRGMIYWSSGSVTVSQDSPQDAAYLFAPANVIDGRFTYQGASAKARHTVALVSWNNPDNFYRSSVEYVEDAEGVLKYGVQQTEIVALGCTSRGQAHRLGKWLLYTERYESETVTFKTGMDGVVSRPGQVIKIADPSRAGARMGGRINSATTAEVTIDQDIAGSISGQLLSVMLADGTVEERTVVSQTTRTIGVQPAFSSAPQAQSVWMLKSDEIEPQTFRVVGVAEDDGGTYTITALRHYEGKFDAVEEDLLLQPGPISILTAAPASPDNVLLSESLYQSASEVRAKLTTTWDQVPFAISYLVRYRREQDNFIELPETSFAEQDILDVQPGTYTVQVTAINAVGRQSVPTEVTKEVFGKTAPPSPVINFSMIPNAGQAYLTWERSRDLDVIVGGQVRIRHTPRIVDQAWKDGVDVVPAVAGTATSAVAPLLTGTYMAKFVDSSGIYSDDEAIIITTVPYSLGLNIIETIVESPDFAGTKTGMTINTEFGALVLADETLFDDLPLIDSIGSMDFPGSIAQQGTYDFENTVDLEGVWPTRIYTTVDLESFDIGHVIDDRADLIDTWEDIDGDTVNDVDAQVYVRTTEDDPAGTPTWTDWKRVHTGEYAARGFQFQLRCTSGSETHNIYIRQLQVDLDMLDRALDMGPITSGTGSHYSVVYPEGFYVPPSIGLTALNLATGDYYAITNADEFGFDIVFKNAAGTIVSRNFYLIAKGYGRKVA